MEKIYATIEPLKPDLFSQSDELLIDTAAELIPHIEKIINYAVQENRPFDMLIRVRCAKTVLQCKKILDNLTDREKETGKYIMQGLSTKMMVDKMKVKEGTIKGYRKTLYKKVGVTNVVDFLAIFNNMM